VSILVDHNTRVIVQGITGREGAYHADLMLGYGTQVVAGVTPGKSGERVHGVPVFDTVKDAVESTGANTSILFVPPRFSKDAVLEAVDSSLPLVVTVAEGIPFQDMNYCYSYARKSNCTLIGPNTPGIISPGKSKVGFMADIIYSSGTVGIMSRSATLSYETSNNLTSHGIGQSTVVGVGGDPIPGSTFVDLLPLFENDSETEVIIILGEIGGSEEENAAEYVKENITKPIVAFIAGEAAPEGKRMGHAGAIVSPGGEGGAVYKKKILRSAGIHVAENLIDIPDMVNSLMKKNEDTIDASVS
jgi:succinyl-CoA synthetase alpha subunit